MPARASVRARRHLLDSLSRLGGVELERRQGELARLLHDDGVVSVAPGATSRRWVLDPVPLLVDSDRWRRIEGRRGSRSGPSSSSW